MCVCVCHVCLLYFEAFNYNTISKIKIKSPIISVNIYFPFNSILINEFSPVF